MITPTNLLLKSIFLADVTVMAPFQHFCVGNKPYTASADRFNFLEKGGLSLCCARAALHLSVLL